MDTSFSISQLSVLPIGDKLFVMNRYHGRWLFLNKEYGDAFRLLGQPADALPTSARDSRDRVLQLLHEARLGEPIEGSHDHLNTLILKLTKVCNYRCKYCYDMEPEDRGSHLSPKVAIKAIDEAIEIAQRPSTSPSGPDLTVILHGGEPTLMFPLIQTVVGEGEQFAERRGKVVRFSGQTNLSRVDAAFVEFSRAHQVAWGISLDGPAATNDRLRVLPSGEGTYGYFERALRQFPEFITRCSVLSVITSYNDSKLAATARHFRDCGMAGWDWTLFQAIGQARTTDGLGFSIDRLLTSWNDLFDAIVAGEFDGFDVRPVTSYLDNLAMGPGANMCMRTHCGAARDLLSVSHDGTIEACDCIDRKGPLANLGLLQIQKKDNLEAARRTARADMIRSRSVESAQCGSCIWLSVCGGTCLAYSPSLHAVHEPHCRIAMNAFSRIVASLAASDALYRYWVTVQDARARRAAASAA